MSEASGEARKRALPWTRIAYGEGGKRCRRVTELDLLPAEAGGWVAAVAAAGEEGSAGAARREWLPRERASEPPQRRRPAFPSWIWRSASGADNAPMPAHTGQSRWAMGKRG